MQPITCLDVCCGSRSFWFDKTDSRAIFLDKRQGFWLINNMTVVVAPDIVGDFTSLPFRDCSFPLVVFDPPHVKRTQATGNITIRYGILSNGWEDMLRRGFAECFRVLRPLGTLVFKWSETEIPLARILALTPECPLFGHKSGKQAKTHWLVFQKRPNIS